MRKLSFSARVGRVLITVAQLLVLFIAALMWWWEASS